MLRPGVASRLASYRNLQGVSVSLYGATPETHDAVTQMPGSWRRTWDGIQRLRRLGVVVRLKLIVLKQTAHEVGAMPPPTPTLRAGSTYMVDTTITARHDGSSGSLATRLDLGQLEDLYRGPLRDLVARGRQPTTEASFPCNCARGNVAIMATGDVHPCVSVPWKAGNVREQSLAEIWATAPVFQRIRGLTMADYPKCAPCGHKDYCMRNRGAAITATGSYTGADPFVCATAEIAHTLADEAAAERQGAARVHEPAVRARLAVVR